VENEDNNNIQLAYLFTHEKEIAKILHIRAVEDKRIYTHENFEYMLVLTLDRQKHVTITAFVGDDNPQIAHSTHRENLNNCSEIYSITHEYPVVRSVFKVSPMVSGGMLLVSSPIEFIYLLTFSKFRSDCKMHKIITLPSGIRKINQLENTQGFKYILANANGGQLLVWARMNDNKYGLIYLDDDPEFTRQTIFHFSKDLRYVYCLFNDKIMRIIFEPLNKPVKLCTNALTTLNEQEERHSFPLGDNHLLNVVKDRIEVKNMFEGTATRLFLPDGWIASFRQSQEKYKDNNNTDVALYSRKDSTTKRWFVAVRCQRIDDDDDDLRSEESKKNFTASSKSATPSTIKNSISDVYFLIFIIDIIDKSRKDPPTPNLKKQEEIIKLDGGIKYENRTQFFFDGNLFGIFYTASNSVLIYDAEVEQASVAARPIKKVNMPGILMFEKEESPSKKIESVDSKSAPDVVRKKKLFIDLWCLGQIRSTGFINFGKHLVVFGKYDEEICSDKNENSIRDEEPQTRKSKKTPFLRPRLLKKSSKSKAPSLMMLEEPLIEDQIDSKVTGPDKDQLNDSFLSHDEDVIEKFKGAEVVSKVWIFSVETINRCHANNIPIDSSQADIELEIQPNQDNVKYSNTGRYLLFYGKGGYTLMYRKKLDDKTSKINYIKRRLRVKEKYSITDSKNIVFSDDDEFLAIAFCHANRTVLFDLRKDDDKRDIVMYKLTKCNRLKEFPLVFTFINNLDGKPTFLSVTDYIEEKKKNSIAYYDISKNIDNCPKLVGPTFNVPLNPVLISSILTTENKLLVSRTILVQGRSKHHRMKTIRMMIHNFAQYNRIPFQYFILHGMLDYFDNSPNSREKGRQIAHQKLVNIFKTLKEDQVMIDERILYIMFILNKPALIAQICNGRANLNALFTWHKLLELTFNTGISDKQNSYQTVADLLRESISRGEFPKINERCIARVLQQNNKRLTISQSCREILSNIVYSSTELKITGLVKSKYETIVPINVRPDQQLDEDFVEKMTRPVMEKDPTISQEYEVYRTQVQIELTNGSPASLGLIEAIMLMPDSELRYKYKQLINFKWNMVYLYIYIYLAFYLLLNVLVYIHFGYSYDWKLGVCIFCLNIQFLTYNFFCLSSEAGLFVRDLNYWLDIFVHALCITCLVVLEFKLIEGVHEYAKLVAITAVSIRGISLLKMFGPLRMLIKDDRRDPLRSHLGPVRPHLNPSTCWNALQGNSTTGRQSKQPLELPPIHPASLLPDILAWPSNQERGRLKKTLALQAFSEVS
jgi:hypothetical protein